MAVAEVVAHANVRRIFIVYRRRRRRPIVKKGSTQKKFLSFLPNHDSDGGKLESQQCQKNLFCARNKLLSSQILIFV